MTSTNAPFLEQAVRAQERGLHDHAIALLRRVLADDPDHARAHALLALSLMHKKRLVAAEHEARQALLLEPELALGTLALGVVLLNARKLDEARALLDEARALMPDDAAPLLFLARLHTIEGDRASAEALLADARALDPEDLDVVVALGDLAVKNGRLDEAREYARAALRIAPDGAKAQVLAGNAALAAGDVGDARAFAHAALKNDATSHAALSLLAACRARSSPLLGVWWRYHAWMDTYGERQIGVAVVMFVVLRLLVIGLDETGFKELAELLGNAWLVFCAYTWIGPALFRRAVERELRSITLKPGF